MSDSIMDAKPGDYVFSNGGRPGTVHAVHEDGLTLEIEYQGKGGIWSVGCFEFGWPYLRQTWNLSEKDEAPVAIDAQPTGVPT